jgi:hypothetical protein
MPNYVPANPDLLIGTWKIVGGVGPDPFIGQQVGIMGIQPDGGMVVTIGGHRLLPDESQLSISEQAAAVFFRETLMVAAKYAVASFEDPKAKLHVYIQESIESEHIGLHIDAEVRFHQHNIIALKFEFPEQHGGDRVQFWQKLTIPIDPL